MLPTRRLEQHIAMVIIRPEILLITYCFKILSIICQPYCNTFLFCSFSITGKIFQEIVRWIKTSFLLKLFCNFTAVVTKDLSRYFSDSNRIILKFIRKKECAKDSWILWENIENTKCWIYTVKRLVTNCLVLLSIKQVC